MDSERYRWVRSHFEEAAALLAYNLDDPDGLDAAIDERIKKSGIVDDDVPEIRFVGNRRIPLGEPTRRIVEAASEHPDWDIGADVDMLGPYKEHLLKEVEKRGQHPENTQAPTRRNKPA